MAKRLTITQQRMPLMQTRGVYETIHSQLFELSSLRPTFLPTLSASEESPVAPSFLFIFLFLSLSVKTLQI